MGSVKRALDKFCASWGAEELLEEDMSQCTRVHPFRFLDKLMTDDFDTAIDQLDPLLRYLQRVRVKAIACIKEGDTEVRAEEGDALCREEIVSQIKPMLEDIEKLIFELDDLYEGILHLNQIMSYLQYMQAAALHGQAGVAGVPACRQKEILTEAYDAAATSVTLFRELTEGRDEEMYSNALILQANLAARLGRSSSKQVLDQARASTDEAIAILRQLGRSPAKAYRVLGVISQQLEDPLTAKQHFLKSIVAFRASGQEYESFWCAVAHFNVHSALKELGELQESRVWLKRATELREWIEGDSLYSKSYRKELEELLKEPAEKPVTLTKQEHNEITRTLDMCYQ